MTINSINKMNGKKRKPTSGPAAAPGRTVPIGSSVATTETTGTTENAAIGGTTGPTRKTGTRRETSGITGMIETTGESAGNARGAISRRESAPKEPTAPLARIGAPAATAPAARPPSNPAASSHRSNTRSSPIPSPSKPPSSTPRSIPALSTKYPSPG